MASVQERVVSRSGERHEDVRQALSLTGGLLARHRPAVGQLAAALQGQGRLAARVARDAGFAARLRELVEAHARAVKLVQEFQPVYQKAMACPRPNERALWLMRIPLPAIVQAGQVFQRQVHVCRQDPDLMPLLQPEQRTVAAPPPGPGEGRTRPGPPAGPGQGNGAPARTGLLAKLTALGTKPLEAPAPAPPPAPEAPPSPVDALRAEVGDVRHVYTYNAPRVQVVSHGVAVYGKPQEEPERVCAGAPGKVVAIAAALARVYRSIPPTLQRSQVAIAQTTEMRRELFGIDQELARIAALPPAHAATALGNVRVAPLRGKALVLANFPRTFAGDPILCSLFPPLKEDRP